MSHRTLSSTRYNDEIWTLAPSPSRSRSTAPPGGNRLKQRYHPESNPRGYSNSYIRHAIRTPNLRRPRLDDYLSAQELCVM
ncbi:hypothetical protein M404DRAFT_1007011, partial [Pisolithus tinctorius Marx 270]